MNYLHRVIWLAALLGALPAFAADFVDLRHIEPIRGDAGAVSETVGALCNICHTATGVSVIPMFPNIGAQKPDYLYWQLRRFKHGNVEGSPMGPLVQTTTEEDLRNFSLHYAQLAPATSAAPIEDQARFDRGAKLYREGDVAKGIPPCQGCHGSEGQGIESDRPVHLGWPKLRHQHAQYVSTSLADYRSGKLDHSSNDFIMQSVAGRLDDDDIAALAAWIASAP